MFPKRQAGSGTGNAYICTQESLVDAKNFVKTMESRQHRKIGCLEEIVDCISERMDYKRRSYGCSGRKIYGWVIQKY